MEKITWEKFFKNNSGNDYPNEIIVRFVMNYYKDYNIKERKKNKNFRPRMWIRFKLFFFFMKRIFLYQL